MKIFHLTPKENTGHWEEWYDKAFGFVVRAENEDEARILASKEAGDEGGSVWINNNFTYCIELKGEGEKGVIIRDFASA